MLQVRLRCDWRAREVVPCTKRNVGGLFAVNRDPSSSRRFYGPTARLPSYEDQLSSFHRAFAPELERVLGTLPLTPEMRVLDLACGDGFYARGIADRLGPDGSVTGVDLNLAYVSAA